MIYGLFMKYCPKLKSIIKNASIYKSALWTSMQEFSKYMYMYIYEHVDVRMHACVDVHVRVKV